MLSAVLALSLFPPFTLENFDGHAVSEAIFEGKATVVVPTYAKCVIACPLVTLLLQSLDESLGSPGKVQYLHLSVNPDADTEEEIRLHFEKHELDPELDRRWLFANGPTSEMHELLGELGVVVDHQEVPEGTLTEHTVLVFVVGPEGEVLAEFDSYFWNEEEMRHALRHATEDQP